MMMMFSSSLLLLKQRLVVVVFLLLLLSCVCFSSSSSSSVGSSSSSNRKKKNENETHHTDTITDDTSSSRSSSSLSNSNSNWDTVLFDTPTVEPGTNQAGKPIISGGMPIGNGETTALVFPLTKPIEIQQIPQDDDDVFKLDAGVHIWISMTTAMASDTSIMPLGIVSIIPLTTTDDDNDDDLTTLFSTSAGFYQILHMKNATVEIGMRTNNTTTSDDGVGGSNNGSSSFSFSALVWCDANTNKINAKVQVLSGTGTGTTSSSSSSRSGKIKVEIKSLRPLSKRFEYSGRCSRPTSGPDEWISSNNNKTYTDAKPIIGLSHRNTDDDRTFPNETESSSSSSSYFNLTLIQQGLGKYVDRLVQESGSDHWKNRQFGFVVGSSSSHPDTTAIASATKKTKTTKNKKKENYYYDDTLIVSSLTNNNNDNNNNTEKEEEAETIDVVITTMSRQTNTSIEWDRDITRLHLEHMSDDGAVERRSKHNSYWEKFWNRSHIWVSSSGSSSGSNNNDNDNDELNVLTRRYAQTRYLQAIQSRTWVPIKFNGMTFTAQLPPDEHRSGPNHRQWGSSNWWQNTRLAYWNMYVSGDFENLKTIFDYYSQMIPFLDVRTRTAFNHTGIYVTETKTLFGAYDPCDYGPTAINRTSKADDLNIGYEYSRWLRYDFGGDAGLTEICVMLLDYYLYTSTRMDDEDEDEDSSSSTMMIQKYMPLLVKTLDFFSKHYGDVMEMAGEIEKEKDDSSSSNGSSSNNNNNNNNNKRRKKQKRKRSSLRLEIFPTQALETYQCPVIPATQENCPMNDHPTVSALHVLTERALLELPTHLSTPYQRKQWKALRDVLPPIPMNTEKNDDGRSVLVVSPYETYDLNSTRHETNMETPELYSTHPFRYFTLGRSLRLPPHRNNDHKNNNIDDDDNDNNDDRIVRPPPRDIGPSIYCLERSKRRTCRNSDINNGWTQGLLNAALLGRAKKASKDVLDRAVNTLPAKGYRFEGFAPHLQDYEPSEDHYANMNTALQLMLISPVDDGKDGRALLFPAWPCHWDVSFKLNAPKRTVVSGTFINGTLIGELRVDPPERKLAIIVLPCQNTTTTTTTTTTTLTTTIEDEQQREQQQSIISQ